MTHHNISVDSLSAGQFLNLLDQPLKIGPLTIKNRIVRSATVEGLSSENGVPSQKLIDITSALAKGGVGLIITGSAYISTEGRADRNTTGLDNDDLIEPLSRLCLAVHDSGGTIASQLLHCGATVSPAILPEKEVLLGPSAMIEPVCNQFVEELSQPRILRIVEDYAKAALRAKKAGFDAIQIHAAHGYLINQFLSPWRNRREDRYGGALKNRARLLYQVVEAVRGTVGRSYPLLIKLSAHDGFYGGVLPIDAARVAKALDTMGIDAIEVSAGTPEGAKMGGWDHIIPAPFEEGSLFNLALTIKQAVQCPVISVEGWRNPIEIAKALSKIDAI